MSPASRSETSARRARSRVIHNLLDRVIIREAVEELERAEACLDRVRCGDVRRNLRRHLHRRRGLCLGAGSKRQSENERLEWKVSIS
jgi:hypothetical protein